MLTSITRTIIALKNTRNYIVVVGKNKTNVVFVKDKYSVHA